MTKSRGEEKPRLPIYPEQAFKMIESDLKFNSMKRKDWVSDDLKLVSLDDAIEIVADKLGLPRPKRKQP